MHLLQTVLSPMGYQKVLDIMGSDQALTDAGKNFASGEAVNTIGIFGQPSEDKPWMLEFGGHHLVLNVVIAGSRGVMTPTLTGAQPSIYAVAIPALVLLSRTRFFTAVRVGGALLTAATAAFWIAARLLG